LPAFCCQDALQQLNTLLFGRQEVVVWYSSGYIGRQLQLNRRRNRKVPFVVGCFIAHNDFVPTIFEALGDLLLPILTKDHFIMQFSIKKPIAKHKWRDGQRLMGEF
jgi:hypothetical protein